MSAGDMSALEEELLPRRHRTTVSEYYRMAELGLLAPDHRVELVAGEIFDMSPIGPLHGDGVDFLGDALKQAVGGQARVRVQNPVSLDQYNEPQPDLAVVKQGRYRKKHPTASDTLLIVEVSDSTLRYDRNVKALLYAAHNIPEFWVLDVSSEQLHIYKSPSPKGYTDVSSTAKPGDVTLAGLPGVTVRLEGLFDA